MREARVRPEYAFLYPWLRPDIWYLAASIEPAPETEPGLSSRGRHRLSDAHFEFRGGASRPRNPAGRPDPERDAGGRGA
jgi:hypothetical protein